MEHLFNLSFYAWIFQHCSPAAYSRAWWEQMPRKQVSSDTHAEKR